MAFRIVREGPRRFVALALALSLAGCSMPIPGFIDDSATGSIKAKTYPFAAEDWTAAEPALKAAIGADANAPAAAWTNPDSGRRGSVAAVGAGFSREGSRCRAFVARIEKDGDRQSFQGSACERRGSVNVSDAGPFSGA